MLQFWSSQAKSLTKLQTVVEEPIETENFNLQEQPSTSRNATESVEKPSRKSDAQDKL